MVRKNCKRSPAKSLRDLRSHQRRRHLHNRKRIGDGNPAATTNNGGEEDASCSAALLSTISRKASKCKNRLIRIFSKLATFVETPKTGSRYRGYQMLKDRLGNHSIRAEDDSVRKVLCFDNSLPPSISPSKPTVFLDLDETLVHSVANDPPENFDFIVRPRIGGSCVTFYVLKRPGLDEFLEAMAKKFELVVFTAGLEEYASMVLDNLDRKKQLISHRLYRDSCNQINGMYVKDLSRTGRDLTNAVIVDDNPNAYSLQPENAIPVRPFVDDLGDSELAKLAEFFDGCDEFGDIRDAVKIFVSSRNGISGEEMAIS